MGKPLDLKIPYFSFAWGDLHFSQVKKFPISLSWNTACFLWIKLLLILRKQHWNKTYAWRFSASVPYPFKTHKQNLYEEQNNVSNMSKTVKHWLSFNHCFNGSNRKDRTFCLLHTFLYAVTHSLFTYLLFLWHRPHQTHAKCTHTHTHTHTNTHPRTAVPSSLNSHNTRRGGLESSLLWHIFILTERDAKVSRETSDRVFIYYPFITSCSSCCQINCPLVPLLLCVWTARVWCVTASPFFIY